MAGVCVSALLAIWRQVNGRFQRIFGFTKKGNVALAHSKHV